MGENIGELNEVSTNLRSLLAELRTGKMTETLDRFIESVHSLDSLEENIVYLEQQKEFLNSSTQELMNAQEAYLLSLELPNEIANKLTSILNRFVMFEDNINKFGEGLAQNQLIGNREINLIQQQINALERNTKVITTFQELSTEELEKVCNNQIDDVNALTKKYSEAIGNHSDEFKEFMDSIAKEIIDKKKEFIDVLEKAFTVADIRTEFKQLNKIPSLLEKLEAIDKALKKDSDLVEKLEDIRLSTVDVFDSVDKLRTNHPLIDSVDDIKKSQEVQLEKLEATKEAIEDSLSKHMQNLDGILDKLETTLGEDFDKGNQSVISKIVSLGKEFDDIKRAISAIPTDRLPVDEIKAIDKKVKEIDSKLKDYNIGDRRGGWSIFGR